MDTDIAPGSRVYVFRVGYRRNPWRAAEVTAVHEDGTVSVLVEGFQPERVILNHIRPVAERDLPEWQHRYGRGHLAAQ
jgi:hypothetical protein